MGLNGSNPINPGVASPVFTGQSLTNPVPSQNQTNQLRGGAALNSTAAGIPQQVTNVSATVANASKGSTSTVTVTFRRNSADKNFSGVNVFVKGYQGNNSWVQVAGGSDSPVTLVLNNTGEAVSILVQARGNAGVAPLASSPTSGIKLPLSSSGGYGNQTTTGGGSATQLTGDVTTTGSSSPLTATVDGFQTVPISSVKPQTGDIWRYNEYSDSKWDLTTAICRSVWVHAEGQSAGSSTTLATTGSSTGATVVGTASTADPTGTEGKGVTYTGASSASASVTAQTIFGSTTPTTGHFSFGTIRRFSARVKLLTTTSGTRYWIGLSNNLSSSTAMVTDTPNCNYAAFRFHNGTDTKFQAVCGTSSAAQTVVNTGVAIDTSASHLFEIAYDGTNVNFFIDGVLVAQVGSNIPAATALMGFGWTGDNNSTANAISATFYFTGVTLK